MKNELFELFLLMLNSLLNSDKDDKKLADDYIGQFIIRDLINYNPPPQGHKILGAFGQYNGCFHLSVESMKSSADTKQLPRYIFDGSCRYFPHESSAIGRLTMLNTNCIYSTWKIQIRRISFFFPPDQRQYWNRQYKSDYPLSLALKNTIKLAHKTLYRRTLKHNENGRLNNTDDLWKGVFLDKISPCIKPCVYTYVIDDNTWRFSQTGAQFFTDFASKHALLANCSESVRYAGEFHPRPNKDPQLKQSVEQLKVAIEKYRNSTVTIKELVLSHSTLI